MSDECRLLYCVVDVKTSFCRALSLESAFLCLWVGDFVFRENLGKNILQLDSYYHTIAVDQILMMGLCPKGTLACVRKV